MSPGLSHPGVGSRHPRLSCCHPAAPDWVLDGATEVLDPEELQPCPSAAPYPVQELIRGWWSKAVHGENVCTLGSCPTAYRLVLNCHRPTALCPTAGRWGTSW